MSRDHRKLRLFQDADTLVVHIYQISQGFPVAERYGLCGQMRKAAVSTATNIVEGCARRSESEYVNFLNIATGSAAETRYLVDISNRLGFLKSEDTPSILRQCDDVVKGLKALVNTLQRD